MRTFFKGLIEGFKDFNSIVIMTVNFVLLSIVYIIGIGLTSIFAKIMKKNFLDIKKTNKDSYWEDLNLKKESFEKYYRQF